jgi:unsaturated rhamnogalacturonyl hydrolase
MMTVIPLAKIGLLLNRPDYVAEAKYQFMMHINYLMDPVSGLWYHGWEFTPEAKSSGHNFAKALWARGNCWITVAIPLFISILGDAMDEPLRRHLVSVLERQSEALVKCQDPKTGLWHTLLVDPSSYVESSAAAGFAAGMLMAIRMGLISEKYLASATKGLAGVIAQIRPDGELENTSFGTGMGRDLQFYKDIPITSMPYGQALAMLALVEWERLNVDS